MNYFFSIFSCPIFFSQKRKPNEGLYSYQHNLESGKTCAVGYFFEHCSSLSTNDSCLTILSFAPPSLKRKFFSIGESSHQTTHGWISLCVWLCGWRGEGEPVACVVNSRYFQWSLTWGNLTLSLDPVWVMLDNVVYVCVYIRRMNVIEFILLREGQLCSFAVQGKHLTLIALCWHLRRD